MSVPERESATPAAPSYDKVLLWAVLGLTTLGLVMIYSASAVKAADGMGDPFYFVKRQGFAALLGLGAMFVAMRIGYRRLEFFAYPLLLFSLLLLILVLIPGIGSMAGGARRWIPLGPLHFQPSELAKLAMVVYLARSLARKREKVRDFSIGFVPHTLVAGLFTVLLLAEPDFGSAVIIGCILFLMLFSAGAKISWLVGSMLVVLPIGIHLVASRSYRLQRVLAFLDPWEHRSDIGYQIAESLIGVGSGGLTGTGLGAGKQKLYFLPEAHTDFIAAVIGEELGLLGLGLLVLLFGLLVWRGMRAAFWASDAFGAYLAVGITALLGLQAVTNLAIVMGLLPTKGLVLPFVSYGGSSLVLSLGAAGLLLAVSGGSGGFLRPQRLSR